MSTTRNKLDAYLSPPSAALALRYWLLERFPASIGEHWLDPFAGPGTLLDWTLAGQRARLHAFEMDARWRGELTSRIDPLRVRTCDSFALVDWTVLAGAIAPHLVTNKPFARTPEAIVRMVSHARTLQRLAAGLMRTDWWQHPQRSAMRPDHMLMLDWRPAFGWRWDKKTARLVWSTDRFTGYVWAVWAPTPTGRTELEWLDRPEVPPDLVAEHKRLARLAFTYGEQGAIAA